MALALKKYVDGSIALADHQFQRLLGRKWGEERGRTKRIDVLQEMPSKGAQKNMNNRCAGRNIMDEYP